ncbi:hypothetical protein DFH29DRAFT_339675 [Suillus ampliporus]|nr:hypothetical protein DFH29DRAFT_339675 [Suillus ampliporus]
MSNSQPADARAALMETVLSRHLQASADGVSPGSLSRRPSRNFNARDFSGHRNQSASPTKRRARQDKSGLVIRGRTIYNPQAEPTTHSAATTSSSRKLMKPTTPSSRPRGTGARSEEKSMSLEILQRMDAEEEKRRKDPYQRFLMEVRGDRYRDDRKTSIWMGVSDPHCHTPERKGGSELSTPSLSPSDSDMEYSPLRWTAPAFDSGEGDWQAMFDMYVKDEECLEDRMRY